MIYHKTYIGDWADGVENLPLTLEGISGVKRRIIGAIIDVADLLWFRAYVDQERMVDVNTDKLGWQINGTGGGDNFVAMDILLKDGQTAAIGFFNNTGGGLNDHEITLIYEEG